jgi:hypothetical protein
MGVSRLDGVAYLVQGLRYKNFRFNGRHLEFPSSVKSDIIVGNIDFTKPENMG